MSYFTSSGDALSKAIKLVDDVKLEEDNCNNKKYALEIAKMREKVEKLRDHIAEAKGDHVFIETEWINKDLIICPKDPRNI